MTRRTQLAQGYSGYEPSAVETTAENSCCAGCRMWRHDVWYTSHQQDLDSNLLPEQAWLWQDMVA